MASRFSAQASALALILAACSGGPGNSHDNASTDTASTHTEIATAGSAGGERAKPTSHAGAGRPNANPNSHSAGGSTAGTDDPDTDGDSAGMGGAAGAGDSPPPCDLEGNCNSDGDDRKVTCDVQPWFECEYAGFVGATAQVGWGQSAVIGIACCGACECVPVEVYFDGARCWQGIPQCDGKLANPHPTTAPNPAFTPRTDVYGTFYLGSGGYGGTGEAAAEPSGSGGSDASGRGGAMIEGEAGSLITPQGGSG